MKFGYADPPYLNCGALYAKHHDEALIWNDPETHRALIVRLQDEFADGWVMSASSPSLRIILPMCPEDIRVGAWVKPFAVFKPNVNPGYTWEPVLFRGGRKRNRTHDTIRDWHSENITMRKGLPGAKPPGFAKWVVDLLGADVNQGDTITDLFPGTGAMMGVWRAA